LIRNEKKYLPCIRKEVTKVKKKIDSDIVMAMERKEKKCEAFELIAKA